MIILLCITILLLVAAIIYLNVTFYKEKKVFKMRIEILKQLIAEISKKHAAQSNQLRLSEDMNALLKTAKATLNQQVFRLNYDVFDLLSKNKLLKK